jgi:hypothetical protein
MLPTIGTNSASKECEFYFFYLFIFLKEWWPEPSQGRQKGGGQRKAKRRTAWKELIGEVLMVMIYFDFLQIIIVKELWSWLFQKS